MVRLKLDDVAVTLHFKLRIRRENHEAFRAYVQEAFPIFEASTHSKGLVFVSDEDPEAFDEVFYYRNEADFALANRLVTEDPVQVRLLQRWHALLDAPPQMEVFRTWR